MLVDVILDTEEQYERDPTPDSSWDNGDRTITLNSVTVRKVNKNEDFEINAEVGDEVIVLIEHYRDGDTFGSYERLEVKGVYTTYKGAQIASEKFNTDHGYFGSHLDFKFEETFIRNSVDYSK